jgi:hypothetical protein
MELIRTDTMVEGSEEGEGARQKMMGDVEAGAVLSLGSGTIYTSAHFSDDVFPLV